MKRNIRFVLLLTKLRLSHIMVFRFSFFGAFIADATLFAVQLLAFGVIYGQVDSIGDWSRGQMLIFIGTFSMLNGLNMLIYFFGLIAIPDKIREGGLDHYLTKPISPLLRLTFESVNPGSFLLLVFSGVIIAHGVSVQVVTVTPGLLLAYCVLVVLMTTLYYDMELILRTIPFLVISVNAIERMEEAMLSLNFRLPGVLFKGLYKVLFYFIMPYGVMATVPTQLLSGVLSPAGLAQGVGAAVFFTAFALWFWRFGLRRYKSASS